MPAVWNLVQDFVDSINDEHLENFPDGNNITIKQDYKQGMRLDHQGLVHGTEIHRLWIQPLPHGEGKSRSISKAKSSDYVARIHVENGCTPAEVRDGLVMSAREYQKIVDVKPGVAPVLAPELEKEKTPGKKSKKSKKK